MRELEDAGPIAADRSALKDRLARDGCLLFRGLVPERSVEEVRTDILRAVGPLGWVAPGTDPSDAVPAEDKRVEGEPGWWDGYRAIQSLESFHRLGHHPVIIERLAALFGEDVLVHPRKIARVIWPQDPTITTPPHQDFTHIGGTIDFLTLWVSLGECPVEQGGLRVLLGSHSRGVVDWTDATGAGGIRSNVDDDDPDWGATSYRPGDAVLFHSLVVHGGLPNSSGRLRVSADYRYQPVSEPISRWSLQPHFYADYETIPSWEEFTSGWSSTEWVAAPRAIVSSTDGFGAIDGDFAANAGANGGRSRFLDSSSFAAQVVSASP